MGFFVYILNIWYLISKFLTAALVLIWNFLANKYWTFKDKILISENLLKKFGSFVIPAIRKGCNTVLKKLSYDKKF
jgi:putative flippase GtrA